jgi:hypothetical protein
LIVDRATYRATTVARVGDRPSRNRHTVLKCLFFRLTKLALLCLFVTALVFASTLDGSPLVRRDESISPQSIAEAKRLLNRNDPRRLHDGDERTASIPAALIDEGVNYLASRGANGRGAFLIAEDSAEVRLTLSLPLARYLNLRASLREAAGEPRIAAASIGWLPVPPAVVEWLVAAAMESAGVADQWRIARQAVRRIAFEPGRATVEIDYIWETSLLERARLLAFAPEDVAAIRAARYALAGLLDHYATRTRLPLTNLLTPLLTQLDGSTRQRRATLLVLAVFLAEKDLGAMLPDIGPWPRPRSVLPTLRDRHDSAQHFGISAALAAWAGEPVANAIGLYKEIVDSRDGSGFSFADLAADRAGTRFGQLVVDEPARLNEALTGGLTEDDLAPVLADLPESLSEKEMTRRFHNRKDPAFQRLSEEIERRLSALPLYR